MFRKRSLLKSPSLVRKKRKRLLSILSAIAFVVIACIGSIVYAAHRPQIMVRDIVVEGNNAVEAKAIESLIRETISGKYVYILPKNNSLLFPRKIVKETLLTRYLDIRSVDVDIEGFTTLLVRVKERKPEALWCKVVDAIAAEDSCYFMDENGLVYAEAPFFSGEVYMRYFGLLDDDPVGAMYAVEPSILRIQTFIQSVDELGFNVTGVFARGNGEYELYLRKGGKIIFNNSQALEVTFTNLVTLTKEKPNLNNSEAAAFEYIDLRFGDKVYLKTR
jgi:cell division septal protein FtsQ